MTSNYKYGKVDRFLHWLIAINIFATLIFSYGMSSLPDAQKASEYSDHGMSVTTIFMLMTVRLIWRLSKGFPAHPVTMSALQSIAAKIVHYSLYMAIFAQIFIGAFLASTTRVDFVARGYGVNYSGFNLLPDDLYDTLLLAHKSGYWIIVSLVTVHILAALKHHFVDKDDVLNEMLPFRRRD